MKILHLIYTHAIAGAERYLVNLLPGLLAYDIQPELICVCPKSSASTLIPYCEMMNKKGIKTILIQGNKKDFLTIAKSIHSYLKKENISVLHSHLSNADLIAVLIKNIYYKKLFIISSKHGYDEKYLVKYQPEANPHIIDRNIYYFFTKFLLRYIDVNLSISKAISDLYFNIKLAAKPYHYIHHGIATSISANHNTRVIPNQLIIIGRLEDMKGHKFLLEAMPDVIHQFPDAKLLILGEGSQKDNLVKQANDLAISAAITFAGFKPHPDFYIQQSEVIVLPSLFEPFGLVYIEAFSLKVPIVAFDVPASNEIITDNETGLLAPKFNSGILAQKIIYLLQNMDERKRIAESAYQKYVNYYTAAHMIRATAAWYKSTIPYNA